MKRDDGFSLLEILVAIAILSVALLAAIRATSSAIQTTDALRTRLAADWVAADRVAELNVRRAWPALGERSGELAQAGIPLVWRERVVATPNSRFRRVEVTVFTPDAEAHPLTQLTAFAVNRPR